MICNKCNNEIQAGVKFCPICGNSLVDVNTNNQVVNAAINVAPMQPGVPTQMPPTGNVVVQATPVQDKVNVWLAILSWFIPLAGLIIFFVKKKTSPKTAKVSGICALISFILNIIIIISAFLLFIGTYNTIVDGAIDESDPVIEDVVEDTYEDDETNNVDDNFNVTVSNNWQNYQVTVGSKAITLPTTYTELSSATGFSFKEVNLGNSLENGYYSSINMYKDGKLALYVEVLNDTGAIAKYTDCKITRISQTKYQVTQGAEAIVFPGGIKAGASITEDQIISLFGAASDIKDYSSGNYNKKEYHYFADATWTTTNNFKIHVVNGVIDEIQLDHRN